MKSLIAYFVKQSTFTNLLTIFVLVLGAFSLFKIQREVFPNVSFETITVVTAYPGASADATERLITNPLEQDLREVEGIKKMTSVSVENQSVIILEIDADETTEEEAKADIQDIVDAFADLPSDAEEPVVTIAESRNKPVVEVSLAGPVSEGELRRVAKAMERSLEEIPEVSKVNFEGLRDYEVKISADPVKLRAYRISLQELIGAIKRRNINIPGGVVESSPSQPAEMIVRTIGEYETAEDVAETVVRANALGRAIRVRDVADVKMQFEKEKETNFVNGSQAISLVVLKKEGADAIRMVDRVRSVSLAERDRLSPKVDVSFLNDSSYFVKRRIRVLSNNLFVGLALVLVVLSLILPVRVAAVAAFGIPFSFLGALAVFYFGDISLNLISMMGLIIVVGMLVDDAIVVTENAQSYIEKGQSPALAAIASTQRIWAPVAASVMTTVIAFAPLMLMSGVMGKFVRFIPLGVIVCLIVSLVECFFILPHHVGSWVKVRPGKSQLGLVGAWWNARVTPLYLGLLAVTLKLRYLVVLSTVGLVTFSTWFAVKKMDFVLFPGGMVDVFNIFIEAPVGTPIGTTHELVGPYEDFLKSLPKNEVMDFKTRIGRQVGRFNARKRGPGYGQISVYLTPETERSRRALDIISDIKANVPQPEGLREVTFERQRSGPPVGQPVSIGVAGDSYQGILAGVAAVKAELEKIEGVSDILDSYIPGKEEVRVRLDEAKAAAAGISVSDVGLSVRAAYEGVVASRIRTLEEEIDLRVSLSSKYRNNAATLDDLEILTPARRLVPLKSIAAVDRERGISIFEHEANRRQVNVTADIDTTVTSSTAVNQIMLTNAARIKQEHPDLGFVFGGEAEDTNESLQTLREAFAFAFFGILLLLILLFQNLYQPLVIATTIPLGIVAVIWTFYLHGEPLSFLGMVGLIALSGVIVNNAIVLVDFYNQERSQDFSVRDAILGAASRRFRPIFLTTITTTVGIVPTAYGWGGLDPFVVPIALALGWGMFFGSILTLLAFPATLHVAEDVFLFFRRKTDKSQKVEESFDISLLADVDSRNSVANPPADTA